MKTKSIFPDTWHGSLIEAGYIVQIVGQYKQNPTPELRNELEEAGINLDAI